MKVERFCALLFLFSAAVWADPGQEGHAYIRSHELNVRLLPDAHQLLVTDRMVLAAEETDFHQLSFTLSGALHVEQVQAVLDGAEPVALAFTTATKPSSQTQPSEQEIIVALPTRASTQEQLTLVWRYQGVINDLPREPRHLRFVTPSETAGHIGPEGVYLSGETQWYPDRAGSLATFRVQVETPEGWVAVTHGKETNRRESLIDGRKTMTSEWDVAARTEALTLVANKFVASRREWRAKTGQPVELATYLFPDDAHLAEVYLEASAKYLDTYIKLLGPYPFPKFAVVENFFASGLGMPSFTLLGSGVIKRHYVQPYALGHEIVHSWIGNSVFNQTDQGNWVEGLTTYLANYYWHEWSGNMEQARDQRRLMLYGYAVHVQPEQDYPVGAFTRKTDEKDNAIGYQKSAMVFHLLRQEIGDAAFWAGLKKLVADHQGVYATWSDIERVFAETSGKDLRWFFAQWVERAGAPFVQVVGVTATPAGGAPRATDAFNVKVRLKQSNVSFRIPVPLRVTLANGQAHDVRVSIDGHEQEVSFPVPSRPMGVELDPDFHLFRKIDRARLPPMLNLYVTDRQRTVVPPGSGSGTERAPYEELVERISAQDAARSVQDKTAVSAGAEGRVLPPAGSVLVLGGPAINPVARMVEQACGNRLRLTERGFTVGGLDYEGPDVAVLVSCHRPDARGRVVTMFSGMTPEAAAKVARLLFFYGWQSYVVFRDGVVVTRGEWDVAEEETEVLVQ